LPREHVEIHIRIAGEHARAFAITGPATTLAEIQRTLEESVRDKG
jgi:hypothetical protein